MISETLAEAIENGVATGAAFCTIEFVMLAIVAVCPEARFSSVLVAVDRNVVEVSVSFATIFDTSDVLSALSYAESACELFSKVVPPKIDSTILLIESMILLEMLEVSSRMPCMTVFELI